MLQIVFATFAVALIGLSGLGAQAQVPITNNPQVGDVAVITGFPPAGGAACGSSGGQPLLCVGPGSAIPLGYFGKATDLNNLTNNLADQIRRQSEGVALAIAQSRTVSLAPGKTFALSMGVGGFEGKASVGVGAIGQVTQHVYLSGGLGVGLSSGVIGGGGAVSLQW